MLPELDDHSLTVDQELMLAVLEAQVFDMTEQQVKRILLDVVRDLFIRDTRIRILINHIALGPKPAERDKGVSCG